MLARLLQKAGIRTNPKASSPPQPQRLEQENRTIGNPSTPRITSDIQSSSVVDVVASSSSATSSDDWLIDYILIFLRSPLWSGPINSFLDINSLLFDTHNQDDQPHIYQQLHSQYQNMMEKLLEDVLTDVGVTSEAFIAAIENGLTSTSPARRRECERVMSTLCSIEDYFIFQKVMVQRNLELECEAYAMLIAHELKQQTKQFEPTRTLSREEEELAEAMRRSLFESEKAAADAAKEDADLQLAIALSNVLWVDGQDKKRMQSILLEDTKRNPSAVEERTWTESDQALLEEEKEQEYLKQAFSPAPPQPSAPTLLSAASSGIQLPNKSNTYQDHRSFSSATNKSSTNEQQPHFSRSPLPTPSPSSRPNPIVRASAQYTLPPIQKRSSGEYRDFLVPPPSYAQASNTPSSETPLSAEEILRRTEFMRQQRDELLRRKQQKREEEKAQFEKEKKLIVVSEEKEKKKNNKHQEDEKEDEAEKQKRLSQQILIDRLKKEMEKRGK